MTLETQIKNACNEFIGQFVALGDPNDRVESLTTFVFGVLATLAGQVDLLRTELISKGIDVGT